MAADTQAMGTTGPYSTLRAMLYRDNIGKARHAIPLCQL